METETLDKLYLEWSQFTKARNAREIEAIAVLKEALYHIRHKTDDEKARNYIIERIETALKVVGV
jgi:hypothetical protein